VGAQFLVERGVEALAAEEGGDAGEEGAELIHNSILFLRFLFVAQGLHGVDGDGAAQWEHGCQQGGDE